MEYVVPTLDIVFSFWVGLALLSVILIKNAVKFVPQNMAYVIERFGKYHKTMEAGLNVLIPFIDRVAYQCTLKEQASDVPSQSAITKDNISLIVDGVLYLKVLNPYRASYGVDDYLYAVTQLAQTTMRSEIGQMDLDKTFEERESLNTNIVAAINEAAGPWGVQVLRYEIKDIEPPRSVLDAMERQMKAEREKRAVILESEGKRQSAINVAEGEKQARVLAAEADRAEQILNSQGEAQAIIAVADAKAKALKIIGDVANTVQGQRAIQLELASGAIEAKKAIAKESSVILLADSQTQAANIVTEAMTILGTLNKNSTQYSQS
ncbi:Regulator of protease activity HflC, stomatin/prohibitin superfamily [Nitrosomonas cryotolerans]|uniref:Regulator of protease activity HflC, stomatin/prohibitin superfamily n=1 Tax=Nitrosomonas cryotolerans ATCC 49181 TaxID=1131553 RepID=A0A1N6HBJ9_9PROT|nr:slipin family protein [Nitrosomonas cryotolerans]SFQ10189.1 Regulator of protease activity HflC, stomatin/prohibitin superfamily [Nitrosomonas cryotolerans]SIO17039.1 Regulator of protease activity HflC, stomatin/prohibitin superfamily [Nitrosomonas cryotolerans ATCC 49181]